MRKLKDFEKQELEDGNTYCCARLLVELHKDICKDADFTEHDANNSYKWRVDFDDSIEKIFTLWGNNGIKYFFDTDMEFRGTKC